MPHDPQISEFLIRAGLIPAAEAVRFEPLAGGVSSDVWKVEGPSGALVVKRALAKLKVAQDWQVPVSRNASEVAWLEIAHKIVPDAAPAVLAHDAAAGLFAMEYLNPATHPVWKAQLRDGIVDLATAEDVGRRIAAIHAASAHDADIARRFANDALFHGIRLEPYIEATARVHRDLALPLLSLSRTTLATHIALVHGDVSPKNILAGPRGPIFLDAECAWFGDPAFDLAFCLNHLLLKCLWTPDAARHFLMAFDRLALSYLSMVSWEPAAAIEERTARLLPALFLARIDGKSPVEYVVGEEQKERVRRVARPLIAAPASRLEDIRKAWEKELWQ
jgi:aminoglycoside phosphotransferase (APT) family kinase protein